MKIKKQTRKLAAGC